MGPDNAGHSDGRPSLPCSQVAALALLLPLQDGNGGEADAAAESATTDSESVSDIQLVRGGGEARTLFKLTLQVRTRRGGC